MDDITVGQIVKMRSPWTEGNVTIRMGARAEVREVYKKSVKLRLTETYVFATFQSVPKTHIEPAASG